MFSIKMLMFTAALMLLLAAVESSSGGGRSPFDYDISDPAELTKLYNSPVYLTEKMRKLIILSLFGQQFIMDDLHSGVRVTLRDGSQWLIHRGTNLATSSQTIVINARHMTPDWRIVETKDFNGTKTVNDFVEAGGTNYNEFFKNCHQHKVK